MKNLGLVLLGTLLALAGVWFSFELRRLGSLGDSENPASADVAGCNTLLTCNRWTLLVKGQAKVVHDANRYSLVKRTTKVSAPNLVTWSDILSLQLAR